MSKQMEIDESTADKNEHSTGNLFMNEVNEIRSKDTAKSAELNNAAKKTDGKLPAQVAAMAAAESAPKAADDTLPTKASPKAAEGSVALKAADGTLPTKAAPEGAEGTVAPKAATKAAEGTVVTSDLTLKVMSNSLGVETLRATLDKEGKVNAFRSSRDEHTWSSNDGKTWTSDHKPPQIWRGSVELDKDGKLTEKGVNGDVWIFNANGSGSFTSANKTIKYAEDGSKQVTASRDGNQTYKVDFNKDGGIAKFQAGNGATWSSSDGKSWSSDRQPPQKWEGKVQMDNDGNVVQKGKYSTWTTQPNGCQRAEVETATGKTVSSFGTDGGKVYELTYSKAGRLTEVKGFGGTWKSSDGKTWTESSGEKWTGKLEINKNGDLTFTSADSPKSKTQWNADGTNMYTNADGRPTSIRFDSKQKAVLEYGADKQLRSMTVTGANGSEKWERVGDSNTWMSSKGRAWEGSINADGNKVNFKGRADSQPASKPSEYFPDARGGQGMRVIDLEQKGKLVTATDKQGNLAYFVKYDAQGKPTAMGIGDEQWQSTDGKNWTQNINGHSVNAGYADLTINNDWQLTLKGKDGQWTQIVSGDKNLFLSSTGGSIEMTKTEHGTKIWKQLKDTDLWTSSDGEFRQGKIDLSKKDNGDYKFVAARPLTPAEMEQCAEKVKEMVRAQQEQEIAAEKRRQEAVPKAPEDHNILDDIGLTQPCDNLTQVGETWILNKADHVAKIGLKVLGGHSPNAGDFKHIITFPRPSRNFEYKIGKPGVIVNSYGDFFKNNFDYFR